MVNKKIHRHIIFEIVFFLYLLTSVLEKLSYNIAGWGCNIYTMATPIVFVFLVISYCMQGKKILINQYTKMFFGYYVIYILYVLFQFVIIDADAATRTQCLKGLIELLVNFCAFINVVMFLGIYEDGLNFNQVAETFLYITFLNEVYCLVQYIIPDIDAIIIDFLNSEAKRYGMDAYGSVHRTTGFFIESNFNGAFLVMGFINALYLIGVYNRNSIRSKKIFASVVGILALVFCFMTLSLTSYIGLAAFAFYKLCKSRWKYKKRILGGLFVLVVTIILVYLFNDTVRTVVNVKLSIFSSFEKLQNSSHFRIAIEAIEIYAMSFRNIIFGTGLNCLNVQFQKVFGYSMMKAHSYYLQNLCELGIIGVGIVVYYIKLLLKKNVNKMDESSLQEVMIFTMLMMNFTYDSFFRPFNIIFIIYALLINKNRKYVK